MKNVYFFQSKKQLNIILLYLKFSIFIRNYKEQKKKNRYSNRKTGDGNADNFRILEQVLCGSILLLCPYE